MAYYMASYNRSNYHNEFYSQIKAVDTTLYYLCESITFSLFAYLFHHYYTVHLYVVLPD